MTTMKSLNGLVHRIQRACTTLGDHVGVDQAFASLWDALPSIVVVGVQKPGRIIALLYEACMFPKSTHKTFAQNMYQPYQGNKRLTKPKLARTDFTINHYAGDVTYQADQFLDKNKDYVIAEHQALLTESQCSFVSNLFP